MEDKIDDGNKNETMFLEKYLTDRGFINNYKPYLKKIIIYLLKSPEKRGAYQSDIVNDCGLSKSLVSQVLRCMKEAGMIEKIKDGKENRIRFKKPIRDEFSKNISQKEISDIEKGNNEAREGKIISFESGTEETKKVRSGNFSRVKELLVILITGFLELKSLSTSKIKYLDSKTVIGYETTIKSLKEQILLMEEESSKVIFSADKIEAELIEAQKEINRLITQNTEFKDANENLRAKNSFLEKEILRVSKEGKIYPDLSDQQNYVIFLLRKGPLKQKEIQEKTGIQRPILSIIINDLKVLDYISISQNPDDNRENIIKLVEKTSGETQLNPIKKASSEIITSAASTVEKNVQQIQPEKIRRGIISKAVGIIKEEKNIKLFLLCRKLMLGEEYSENLLKELKSRFSDIVIYDEECFDKCSISIGEKSGALLFQKKINIDVCTE